MMSAPGRIRASAPRTTMSALAIHELFADSDCTYQIECVIPEERNRGSTQRTSRPPNLMGLPQIVWVDRPLGQGPSGLSPAR